MSQPSSTPHSGKSYADGDVVQVAHHVAGVKCDGGSGALGHPAVYYTFDGKPQIICGYCGRKFVRG